MNIEKFKNIVLPLKDKLFRLAFSITGSREDAEDIVQDTMLRVWNKQEVWENIENLEGYCMRSTRNIALDKIALTDNKHEDLPDSFIENEHKDRPDEVFEKSDQLNLIHQLIARLPEKQRTIMQLRDVEELSYKDIAEIMNITEEQVKVSLFRARQKVKEHFKRINNYGLNKD